MQPLKRGIKRCHCERGCETSEASSDHLGSERRVFANHSNWNAGTFSTCFLRFIRLYSWNLLGNVSLLGKFSCVFRSAERYAQSVLPYTARLDDNSIHGQRERSSSHFAPSVCQIKLVQYRIVRRHVDPGICGNIEMEGPCLK